MRVRAELFIDRSQVTGLGDNAFEVLRPDLETIAGEWARTFKRMLQLKLSRFGSGKLYKKGGKRASAEGESPAMVTGEYRNSFETDVRSITGKTRWTVFGDKTSRRASVQGRIGSKLWHFGKLLEAGNKNIRPRPHVEPTFRQWVAKWNASQK